MRLLELITEPGGCTLSHTKLWSNVGFAAATVAFVRANWNSVANAEVWWAYMVCVAGAVTASKYLALRHGQPDPIDRSEA